MTVALIVLGCWLGFNALVFLALWLWTRNNETAC